MNFTRLALGDVVLRDGERGVVLHIDGPRVAIAPIERAVLPLLRGDVEVDLFDLSSGSSGSGIVARCGTLVLVPAAGQTRIAHVGLELLAQLQRHARRAAESRLAEAIGSTGPSTLTGRGINTCGRRIGRAGL